MLLAAVAHGEQRHMTAAGDAYLIAGGGGGGGRGRGAAAAASGASAADGAAAAADAAPETGRDAAQFAMPFEAAFQVGREQSTLWGPMFSHPHPRTQAITARFGGTMAAPARRHKAAAAAAVDTAAAAVPPGMPTALAGLQVALGKERAALRVLDDEGGDARWLLSRTMALRAWERLLALDLLRFAGEGTGGGGGACLRAGLTRHRHPPHPQTQTRQDLPPLPVTRAAPAMARASPPLFALPVG